MNSGCTALSLSLPCRLFWPWQYSWRNFRCCSVCSCLMASRAHKACTLRLQQQLLQLLACCHSLSCCQGLLVVGCALGPQLCIVHRHLRCCSKRDVALLLSHVPMAIGGSMSSARRTLCSTWAMPGLVHMPTAVSQWAWECGMWQMPLMMVPVPLQCFCRRSCRWHAAAPGGCNHVPGLPHILPWLWGIVVLGIVHAGLLLVLDQAILLCSQVACC